MHPIGLLGVAAMILIAWSISYDRRRFPWRLVAAGVALQAALAFLLIRFEPAVAVFGFIARGVNAVIGASADGIRFLFGPILGDSNGIVGYVFAVQALSVIIYFASLMAVLYHLGIMQRLIAALAWLLMRTLRVTGTEALAIAANVFVGQTEAPLCVKPYLERMTRSQLMTLMVGGFATIAGSVLAVFVGILGGDDEVQRELFTRHLITASVMSAPAAFVIAKILAPETDTPVDEGLRAADSEVTHDNVLDAAASGASDGLRLALNVGAMLIAFASLLALVNLPLAALGPHVGVDDLSLERLLGWAFTPLAWCMGVTSSDVQAVGSLMGQKLVLTEFIAYLSLGESIKGDTPLDPRSVAIATFALCGFANFPSIAIQIGGLTAIAPSKRPEVVKLGVRAMFGGALASFMTASIAGVFL